MQAHFVISIALPEEEENSKRIMIIVSEFFLGLIRILLSPSSSDLIVLAGKRRNRSAKSSVPPQGNTCHITDQFPVSNDFSMMGGALCILNTTKHPPLSAGVVAEIMLKDPGYQLPLVLKTKVHQTMSLSGGFE
ncbi:hypothetical protein PGTUg99_005793 [Puccinia graminis f. sp. tritici]|uniref:Uncharacterized protein n=1 Tax=Puccinia graminis f. sp. tritici TaxID=56615 RepID=A0A5B0RV64_PUCGR|nr:hypothetical protein PGTUg99_005793 [Puccinia graminis f. sp. tritici]